MNNSKDIKKRINLAQGEVLIRQGEFGVDAYVIQSGQLEVFMEQNGKEITLAVLGPGEVVGEQAVLFESTRTASVRALSPSSVAIIDRDNIAKKLAQSDPSIRAIVKILSQRLEETSKTVAKAKNAGLNNRKVDAIFNTDRDAAE